MMSRIERIEGRVKNYAWGKHGADSEVALLYAAGHPKSKVDNSLPYAELWVGTHPDGPAQIRSENIPLSKYIARGSSIESVHLPYIMKIMSINHTLSLQVHPTKEQAVMLNKKDPINYPDQNHKPELAYALSRFELLCGFRPAHEIKCNMKAFPELYLAMGKDNCSQFIFAQESQEKDLELSMLLKKCFSHMLMLNKHSVHDLLINMINRIKKGVEGCLTPETKRVMLDIYKRFPNDIGCMSPLFLNHIILEPGECVYYGAQELHAYLSGECVECVSCSNNTIRAGLTNKFVDKGPLIEILNYHMTDPMDYYVLPRRLQNHQHIREFVPDCKDFTLHCLQINSGDLLPLDLPALNCPSVFIILQADEAAVCVEMSRNESVIGPKFTATRGDIFYIPPMRIFRFLSANSSVLGYRTFSYEDGPDISKVMHAIKMNTIIEAKSKNMHSFAPRILEVEAEIEMDGFI